MFENPTYLHIYDYEFDDEEVNENCYEKPWFVDMCKIMTPNDTSPNVEEEKDHNQHASIEKTSCKKSSMKSNKMGFNS
jgi:hypothetical protein